MTAREAFVAVREELKNACITEPDAKAREIVAHVLGIEYADIFFYQHVAPHDIETINAMARRCKLCEPVQYITGKAYFRHLALSVTPDVLIPRKETELVVQKGIDLITGQGLTTALDLCTGSGCIAISLATETPAVVEACDISEKALKLARQNAIAHGAAIRFFMSDMFSGADRTYDLIVSNPPYVSEDEYSGLTEDVRCFEPKLALVAEDGLAFYRRIAQHASQYLNDNGMLVLEIGAKQAASIAALLTQGFDAIECYQDYEGRDRIVTARKKQGTLCLTNWTNTRKDSINSKTS